MKKSISLCVACLLLCVGMAQAAVNIIPKPTAVTEREGAFQLKDGLTIGYNDPSLAPAAAYLQEVLARDTGLRINVKAGKGKIQLSLVDAFVSNGEDEAYELVSDKKGVLITASGYRGIVNGIATLRQLTDPSKSPLKGETSCAKSSPFKGEIEGLHQGLPRLPLARPDARPCAPLLLH